MRKFLEEQSNANKDTQNEAQAVIDNIWVFKDQVMDIQRDRFVFLLSNLLENFTVSSLSCVIDRSRRCMICFKNN